VKYTDGLQDTAQYLAQMTHFIGEKYQSLDLKSATVKDEKDFVTYEDFHSGSKKSKELAASDVFQRMLMQMHGVTLELAAAVTEKFPTLAALARAYDECNNGREREEMLSGFTYAGGRKKIRAGISKVLASLYYDDGQDLK